MLHFSNKKSIKDYLLAAVIIFSACNHPVNRFQAPTKDEPGWIIIQSNACYFNFKDSAQQGKKIILTNAEKEEIEQINYLMRFTGLPQNFKIYRGNISTALATTYKNERIIIYNKDLFNSLNKMDNAYWSTLFILAHEIGHHLAYTISDTVNFSAAELQADKFAGSLLYNMGADSNQALIALNTALVSDNTNSTNRIYAAKEGWNLGYKYRYQSVTPPSIDDELKIKEYDERSLLFNSYWKDLFYNDVSIADTLATLKEYESYGFKKLKGIVLQVKKNKAPRPDLENKGFIQLHLLIRITNADSSSGQYFPENEKSEFIIDYEPRSTDEKEKDFFNFFTEGRRLEFDIMFLTNCDGCPYNITKAKAIYNSY